MRGKSHRYLGKYLADRYLASSPKRYVYAFLLGCVEPDKNPATYLKGSLRHQWLRGHNFGNAQRYMGRICGNLQSKEKLKIIDYYKLGKLIHYTADAFTYVHNEQFDANLSDHRGYEHALQDYFLSYLNSEPAEDQHCQDCAITAIRHYHRDYIRHPVSIQTDSDYAFRASCCVFKHFCQQKIPS